MAKRRTLKPKSVTPPGIPISQDAAAEAFASLYSMSDRLRFSASDWAALGEEGQQVAKALSEQRAGSIATGALRRVAQKAVKGDPVFSQLAVHPDFIKAFEERLGQARGKNLIGNEAAVKVGLGQQAEAQAAAQAAAQKRVWANNAGRAMPPGMPGDVPLEDLKAAAAAEAAVPGVAATARRAARVAQAAALREKMVGNPLRALASHEGWAEYWASMAAKAAPGAEAGLIGKAVGGGTSRALKLVGKMGRLGTAATVAAVAPFALDLGLGIASDTKRKFTGAGLGEPSYEEQMAARQSLAAMQMQEDLRRRRLAELTASNAQRLMTEMPELANQLLAGRELPTGAVVIGGDPNVDLLHHMASRMTMGAYSQQGAPQGDMMPSQMMGVQ